MSHGVMHTANMAFPSTSRSFANLPTAPFSEANRNGNASSHTASLGNGAGFAGPGNIWSISKGTNSRDPKSDSSKSRDFDPLRPSKQAEVEGITGSRDLLRGSQPTGVGWSSSRQDVNDRSLPNTRYPEQQQSQPRHLSTGGMQRMYFGSENISPTSTRPPIVNITTQGFTNAQNGGGSSDYKKAPVVYTKMARAQQPVDTPQSSVSPTDMRKAQWSFTPSASRDSSQPPSRHSNQEPSWPESNLDPNSRYTPGKTRNHSVSSQRPSTFGSFQSCLDQVSPQFSQFNLNTNGHAAALRKNSDTANGYMAQKPASNLSSFHFSPRPDRSDPGLSNESEESEQSQMNYLGLGAYTSTPSNDFLRYQNQDRFVQTPAPFEFRPGQTFSNGPASPRKYEHSTSSRLNGNWPAISDGGLTGQSPSLSDPQSIFSSRMQSMMAMRTPYAEALYNNSYALSGQLPLGAAPSFWPLFPVGLPELDSGLPPRDPLVSDGVQSAKLYEFKNFGKNNKSYELKDIFDHIAEFAGDQYGSRFIQTKLENANSDVKERVFREIEPNAIPLMTDVFGNYVIQKFFDHGHQDHKKMLANKMRGQVLSLSMQMYGCRVVQKALEHVLVEQQSILVGELENHVLQCVKDQNGNHVIQKAIERCPSENIAFIYQAFLGQVQHLSLHPYGCRVIQRCLERQDWFPSKSRILAELHDSMQHGMIADQYGNYVVQHVIAKGGPMDKKHVFSIVLQGVEGYSKHKFASNVVEKCIEHSDDAWRREVVNVLVMNNQRRVGGLHGGEGESVIAGLIKDNFGNYVIQKLLDKLSPPDYIFFHQHLQPAVLHAKRTGGGKQLVAIEKKMHRFPFPQHPQSYPIALPPTPFASNYGSVANTPPPLTADTRSLQSSGIPSVNGDTVEGATSISRKGSEPSNDGVFLR